MSKQPGRRFSDVDYDYFFVAVLVYQSKKKNKMTPEKAEIMYKNMIYMIG